VTIRYGARHRRRCHRAAGGARRAASNARRGAASARRGAARSRTYNDGRTCSACSCSCSSRAGGCRACDDGRGGCSRCA